jgi:hypothetical protein
MRTIWIAGHAALAGGIALALAGLHLLILAPLMTMKFIVGDLPAPVRADTAGGVQAIELLGTGVALGGGALIALSALVYGIAALVGALRSGGAQRRRAAAPQG